LLAHPEAVAQAKIRYPEVKDWYVNDFAKILTAENITSIRTVLSKLNNDTGIEVMVVTVPSIHSYKTGDQTIESFATGLFNTWGIGNGQRNDGILILVAVKDRKVRIEAGSGYGQRLNYRLKRVIDEQMVPNFKNGDYGLGIL